MKPRTQTRLTWIAVAISTLWPVAAWMIFAR